MFRFYWYEIKYFAYLGSDIYSQIECSWIFQVRCQKIQFQSTLLAREWGQEENNPFESATATALLLCWIRIKTYIYSLIWPPPDPLQSCCCPVQKNLPRKAELAWQVSRYLWRDSENFKIKNSRPLFTIIFKSKIVRLQILVVHLLKEF